MDDQNTSMISEQDLLHLEEQFWTGDASFYREHLTEDSVMVFAEPVGMLTKDETVTSIAAAPRWTEVKLQDVHFVRLTGDAILLTYRADAHREEGAIYSTLASSVYVHRDGSWALAFHQQSPGG